MAICLPRVKWNQALGKCNADIVFIILWDLFRDIIFCYCYCGCFCFLILLLKTDQENWCYWHSLVDTASPLFRFLNFLAKGLDSFILQIDPLKCIIFIDPAFLFSCGIQDVDFKCQWYTRQDTLFWEPRLRLHLELLLMYCSNL